MPDYKVQEKIKYAMMLAALVVTLLVASAFALHNKESAIRVRQMARSAIHVAVVTPN